MELTERFVVPATVDRVWQLFDDVPEVVTCMPGAQVTERIDDQTYKAQLTIAVGPIRPKFDVQSSAASASKVALRNVERPTSHAELRND